MGVPLTYTRPKHVDAQSLASHASAADSKTGDSVHSGGSVNGIPESLGFDNIINGGTCPPVTVRDFMNYLIYIEHSAENLQFFLWYKDYIKRFGGADTTDLCLSPEWTQSMEDEVVARLRRDNADKMRPDNTVAAELFKGTDFEKHRREAGGHNPFTTPPRGSHDTPDQASLYAASHAPSSTTVTYRSQASEAFNAAGAKQPFSIQPFREEINRVIATYIMDGSPRQLNLASWEQKAAVQALAHTTHPSALRLIAASVETTLRRQAHPNFVRWSICNGNPARVLFARCLGVGTALLGVVAGVVLCLSGAGRAWRALTAVAFVVGISTLVAASKGMCVVLHGMHHRHVRPWELFTQDTEKDGAASVGISKGSLESFDSCNSYEDEPWVVKYEKRNVVRKIFDREVWIQEPALRQIQDIIFIQSVLASLLFGGVLTGIFVAVPAGHLF
ncbi:Regulator of G protein signaling superfamily [Cordyceps fumosorosea ARSEF 2679]|uniref:Regulator of G protein signaling superfamily n=1 Tax=Cordyceps fumosorosea (strain ARSEF 2679) TaxID=1081104 RepID=A0A168D600_CORFA|nr:Regulator of G protein signaling superfamily [Cordyceps fumosorosea ARSEF 2679]OAA72211.1 Regulator of G protein signaling superfamily [Cordyceps fumosorosea ARSEF 2679]